MGAIEESAGEKDGLEDLNTVHEQSCSCAVTRQAAASTKSFATKKQKQRTEGTNHGLNIWWQSAGTHLPQPSFVVRSKHTQDTATIIWVHAGAVMQTARTHHTQTQPTYTNVCSMWTLAQCKRVQHYADRQYHSHDLFEGGRIWWARTNLAHSPMFFLLLFLLFLLFITRVRIYFDIN